MSYPQDLPHPSSSLAMTAARNQRAPGQTHQHRSASFRQTARAINTLPLLARTPRVLGMENSFTGQKEHKRSLLVRTVCLVTKAYHRFSFRDGKPPFSRSGPSLSDPRLGSEESGNRFLGMRVGLKGLT